MSPLGSQSFCRSSTAVGRYRTRYEVEQQLILCAWGGPPEPMDEMAVLYGWVTKEESSEIIFYGLWTLPDRMKSSKKMIAFRFFSLWVCSSFDAIVELARAIIVELIDFIIYFFITLTKTLFLPC